MSSIQDDRTLRAIIRDEALRLFAERGAESVTIREIAAAARVSPGLVIHHYASKQGLRDAVDAHVVGIFNDLFARTEQGDLDDLMTRAPAPSFAEVVLSVLPAESPVPRYLRRLLLAGDPAGLTLFRHWFAAGVRMVEALVAAGVMRPTGDPATRAAFLMSNDLALLLLRDQIADVLGTDPLSREGMARWAGEVLQTYRHGIFHQGSPDDTTTDLH